jgi:hypothetical protein
MVSECLERPFRWDGPVPETDETLRFPIPMIHNEDQLAGWPLTVAVNQERGRSF